MESTHTPPPGKRTLSERIDAHTDKSGECWIWTGSLKEGGYGRVQVGGRCRAVHRVVYEINFGSIPDGLEIDHRCHSRACVRPEHLAAVTRKQNQENRSGPQRNSTSGVRGVTWDKRTARWRAKVRHNRRTYYVGLFVSLSDAESAVVAKRIELFSNNILDRT